jgi:two-component system CheB/CheR fusion protein
MWPEGNGYILRYSATAEPFVAAYTPGAEGCLPTGVYLPGINRLKLLQRLRASGHPLPAIMTTSSSDAAMAV